MSTIEILFWFGVMIIFYTYIGYGILLYTVLRIKRIFMSQTETELMPFTDLPKITLLIPAYNEKGYVAAKMENTQSLDYPKDRLDVIWITDGSDDGTPDMVRKYEGVGLMHQKERKGKIAAMNRAMKEVRSPIVVFSDANTTLGKSALRRIAAAFSNPAVGCVSGEKRIVNKEKDIAAGAGEGLYWKYESALKRMDAELNTAVGAAGELFAIRTDLYREVENDTILDDFIISLRIAMQGYKIAYDPEAYAIESSSLTVQEELKRKIRIAAGGIQSVIRLAPLMNIFRYGLLSFQYISHRVLRWTLTPVLLPLVFILNIILSGTSGFYLNVLALQVLFYLAAIAGGILENNRIKIKGLFIPYYFLMMNWAVYRGFMRFLSREQTVLWERVKRAA
jgi:cellulose synthase/poly-beta-1,6-N-acetylglucosamine synthase-like glycosyltransferase